MSNAAPGDLEKIRTFVNTWDLDEGTEALDAPSALDAWLAATGLTPQDGAAADATALRHAIELREALRALLMHNAGLELDDAALPGLDRAARRAQLVPRFAAHDAPRLEPCACGVDGALGQLLAIVAAAMADGSWPRLKACVGDDCQWAFYDRSRNRSALWCDMAVCGNRHKVRSFRERRLQAGRTP